MLQKNIVIPGPQGLRVHPLISKGGLVLPSPWFRHKMPSLKTEHRSRSRSGYSLSFIFGF